MWCISVKIMVISVRQKNVIYFQPFLKMRKLLLDMRKDFPIMSNFYLFEILSEPNSLTIVTSKKLLKMSKYVPILSICISKWESGICSVQLVSLKGLLSLPLVNATPLIWWQWYFSVPLDKIMNGFFKNL